MKSEACLIKFQEVAHVDSEEGRSGVKRHRRVVLQKARRGVFQKERRVAVIWEIQKGQARLEEKNSTGFGSQRS